MHNGFNQMLMREVRQIFDRIINHNQHNLSKNISKNFNYIFTGDSTVARVDFVIESIN